MSHESCGCCDGCSRRDLLTGASVAAGSLALGALGPSTLARAKAAGKKEPAKVRAAFVYPPSETFAKNPNGWWSWPGNEFDAEGRQKQYTAALREMEQRIGVQIAIDDKPVGDAAGIERLVKEIQANKPDGLLVVMFYNRSLKSLDPLFAAAEKAGIPVIFYIGLGVKHGSVTPYRKSGMYLIQSLDNMEAIESGLRMIHAKKRLGESVLLSINEAEKVREGKEAFVGTTVRVIPFARYAKAFHAAKIDPAGIRWIDAIAKQATEKRGLTRESLHNAARAHLALKQLLTEEHADGLTMNCLKRGMLKPCVSFSALNDELIPAACENDLPAVYTQLLGQLLVGRPGFQHNPCYETERNHYYASHCTCPTKVYGPAGPSLPYLLRRFAHTNEGSTAIQVFWKEGDPVTMVRYYPGKAPALDVYAGKVVKSHPMPPAAGCTTNVEIAVTDRPDACMVRGHHNLLFVGDFARRFRLFANLHKIRLAKTGYTGRWPA